MGLVYYKGKPVPLFESMAAAGDVVYGLAMDEDGRKCYLYEVNKTPMQIRMCLKVEEGTTLELGIINDEIGVSFKNNDGSDAGFLTIPV